MNTGNRFDHLRIASPCPTSWEKMSGDDRVRSCDLCNLQVYNIASLTRKEAEDLMNNTEGRICARLYRRADGTIITKDCPVGLRAVGQRVGTFAGAVFAMIASLSGSVLGQKQSQDKSSCTQQVRVTRGTPDSASDALSISGIAQDASGAMIAGVKIKLARQDGAVVAVSETDAQGSFKIRGLLAGTYKLRFESRGFAKLEIVDVKLAEQESVTVSAIMLLKNAELLTGVVSIESPLETTPGTIILNSDFLRRLPIRE